MTPVVASNLVFNTLHWQSAKYGHFELDHLQITALVAFYLTATIAIFGTISAAYVAAIALEYCMVGEGCVCPSAL
jgi:hypothetical protein